jgi:hypothetical protein
MQHLIAFFLPDAFCLGNQSQESLRLFLLKIAKQPTKRA